MMKRQGIIKRAIKTVADVPTFVDKDFIAYTWNSIRRMVGFYFIPQKPTLTETFEQAMVRLQLTEEDLLKRMSEFSRLTTIFLFLALISFTYTIYSAAKGETTSFLIGFIITLMVLTRAFYFHFWLFQIRNRKLGCSIKEWFNSSIVENSQGNT